jgi:hypothetical protein
VQERSQTGVWERAGGCKYFIRREFGNEQEGCKYFIRREFGNEQEGCKYFIGREFGNEQGASTLSKEILGTSRVQVLYQKRVWEGTGCKYFIKRDFGNERKYLKFRSYNGYSHRGEKPHWGEKPQAQN